MKTDETNFVRNREPAPRERGVTPLRETVPGHPRAPAEREMDAFDLWRARRAEDAMRDDGGGAEPSPSETYRKAAEAGARQTAEADPHDAAAIHGIDLEKAPAAVRDALNRMAAEMADMHRALEAAGARIDRLEADVERDSLTDLLNWAGFLHEIAHVRTLDDREGGESSIALMDILQAPDIRRRYGRAAMDRLQRHVADALSEAAGSGELLAAMGEGEFAIILPGRTGEEARERLRAVLKRALDAPFRVAETDVALTADVGLASANWGDRPEDALDAADADLRGG